MRDWDSFVFNGHSEVGLMIVLVRCWLLGIASGKKTKYCMQRWRTPHSDPYNRPGPIRSGFCFYLVLLARKRLSSPFSLSLGYLLLSLWSAF